MQTYAVVDGDFRFVKIGRTTDIESRLATLNTAQPKPLVLMATFDGDIENQMHRLLVEHRERLEWFRYNDEVEAIVRKAMTTTLDWLSVRGGYLDRKLEHVFDLIGRDHDTSAHRIGERDVSFGFLPEFKMLMLLAGDFGDAICLRKRLRVSRGLVIAETVRLLDSQLDEKAVADVERVLFAALYFKDWHRRTKERLRELGKAVNAARESLGPETAKAKRITDRVSRNRNQLTLIPT